MTDRPARKISVSLPADIVDDLDQVAKLSGLSRSAFLSAVLAQSLPVTRSAIFDYYIASGKDASTLETLTGSDKVKRYRSASKAIADELLTSVLADEGLADE